MLEVGEIRRPGVKARMRALAVVEVQIRADRGARLAKSGIEAGQSTGGWIGHKTADFINYMEGDANTPEKPSDKQQGEALEDKGQPKSQPKDGAVGAPPSAGEAVSPDAATASDIGVLRDATSQKGYFGLGSGTVADSDRLGKAFVGPDYRETMNGKIYISKDGLRQYRAPSWKPKLGKTQSNFETCVTPSGEWQGNGHLDIIPGRQK